MERSAIQFIRYALALLSLYLLPSLPLAAQQLLDPTTVPKFQNALPIPPVLDATNFRHRNLQLTATQFRQDLGLGLRDKNGRPVLTTVWGFNGHMPGPTILARKNMPVRVKWQNRLVDRAGLALPHLLPMDTTIDYARPTTAGVPMVIHLHGGHVEPASDGAPEGWYTPYARSKGEHCQKGDRVPYFYENSQEAASLWYHDHTQGLTRLNVYAGLSGFYLITDDNEQRLRKANQLPQRRYDIGLNIQDRMFTAEGQLFYPSTAEAEEGGSMHHRHTRRGNSPETTVLPEFFGNVVLVNGKAWPYLAVEPRQYRFRLLNGSDSRFYHLKLTNGLRMWQIASDNGLLPRPVLQKELLLAPGERKDVIIDFSNASLRGKTIVLTNDGATPYPDGDDVLPEDGLTQIMAFRVTEPLTRTYPLTPVPAVLQPNFAADFPTVTAETPVRKLILFEGEDEYGRLKPMLGTMDHGTYTMADSITENPGLNSTEIWEIYNLTEDAHPIHLHLVSFRVLSTQKFTGTVNPMSGALSNVQLLGHPRRPDPGQDGKKDTYPIFPGEMARLVATFDKAGLYTWHCHILSHEDHEMMRHFYVGPMPKHTHDHATPGVAQGPAVTRPGSFYRLYPNPFSTATTLQLNLPEATLLRVRLLDVNGRVVREVPAQQVPPGQHELEMSSAGLQNGLYICEVQANQKTYRSRLLLAR